MHELIPDNIPDNKSVSLTNVLEEEFAVHTCASGGLVLKEIIQKLARLDLHQAVETQLVFGVVLPCVMPNALDATKTRKRVWMDKRQWRNEAESCL